MKLTREKLYCKICHRFPYSFVWKAMRLLLWGKVNFNSLDDWERAYTKITKEDIQKLQNRIPNIINRVVSLVEEFQDILEISGGLGNLAFKIPKNKSLVVTEFSDGAIDYLTKNRICAVKALLPKLPFDDNSFDVTITISVFEHLKNKREIINSFEELYRITRKVVIFSVPYECMEPWNTLEHNFIFSKNDIEHYIKNMFVLKKWEIIKDHITYRSISYLEKIY